jgi:site-specific recombinase XerD
MYPEKTENSTWTPAPDALKDAFNDFILSRQAILCSPSTLRFYQFTAGKFVEFLARMGLGCPSQVGAKHVRAYLAELASRDLSDSYIHGHARAVKTLVRFWYQEAYIPERIEFRMPHVAKKRLLVLTAEEVQRLIQGCSTKRDKAIVMLLVDSGLRRAELCALNWEDIELSSGLVRVERGKGGKARSVVVGIRTRRALIAIKREVKPKGEGPVFHSVRGGRLSARGVRSMLMRLGQKTGVDVTAHALRRTFATLALRAGMNIVELQAMMGHSSIEMTREYIQMLDGDLIEAHREHGPVDKFL